MTQISGTAVHLRLELKKNIKKECELMVIVVTKSNWKLAIDFSNLVMNFRIHLVI